MPDFSSHVASTFGSSSKALLAFLSVMTLKEGISNLNMDELNANSVSCAEALKMIDSLREIASIEDSHKLKVSLSNLQQSASKQLLQSWKGFQELGEKCKSRSTTPNDSEHELATEASPDCGIAENVIDEFIDNLDIPEELKEELASLSGSVKSDSDDNEKMSADIMEPKDNSTAKISNFPTEDVGNVRDVTQDETTNVDVSSIIKRFTDITQPKQSRMGSLKEKKPTDQATKDKDSKYGQNGAAKCPPAEPNEHIHEERQLYSTGRGEKTQQQGHDEDTSNQEKGNMNGVVSRKSIAENGHAHEDESGSEKEGQNMSSANKDLEQNKSCEQSVSSLGEPQVEFEGIQQESDDLSNHESHSEGEEDKQPSSSYYAELSIRASDTQEEEQPEVEGMELSNKDVSSTSVSPSHSEKEEPASSIRLNVTADESHSDVDEPSSEEEDQPEVQCKGLKAIVEEGLSGNEEESLEEEEHLDDLPDQTEKALIEETEENKISSDETTTMLMKHKCL
ncbi:hypothetical protein D5F01_LYC21888 [Larimichthys crocea]|uniref:Uncharacterized protein n=1 Tax=Larimichthys crocea TaxID=215358 RepID=A0A6G0HKI9_LARCR|nr:hypothetical protein D5F01_LYC21888 [Larimichthys crocea]